MFPEVNFAACSKQEARQILKNRRDRIPPLVRKTATEGILAHLKSWISSEFCAKPTITVGFYAAIRNEVDLSGLFAEFFDTNVTVGLPKVSPRALVMDFFEVHGEGDLESGSFGIREPSSRCKRIAKKDIDLILIPGLGFTTSGQRLGYGGGYYDRYLSDVECRAVRMGVLFHELLVTALPTEEHDVLLHFLVTETGVMACST